MTKCLKCKRELGKAVISISGSIMGDEHIDSLHFCENCQLYTVETYCDRFMGDESIHFSGPFSKKEGDQKVRLIKKCFHPSDKKCRCKAHKEYFGSGLD